MKIKLLSILFILFAFTSCTKDSIDFALTDWVGNWAITNEQPKNLLTKASLGNIRENPTQPNTGILISGKLFNAGTMEIPGTVSGNAVTFHSASSYYTVSGTGEMTDANTIEFTWTVNDGADATTYTGTARKQ